jgi:hypothetical protein
MKIVLLFCPFSGISGIPLGIAQLKSYSETNTPSVKIRNFDPNIKLIRSLAHTQFLRKHKKLLPVVKNHNKLGGLFIDKSFSLGGRI